MTQKATESDDPGLEQSLAQQARSGLHRPAELYVDGAYVSAARLREANQKGCELIGPAQPSANRAGLGEAYRYSIEKRPPLLALGRSYRFSSLNVLYNPFRERTPDWAQGSLPF